MEYQEFLKQKEFNKVSVGFTPTDLNANLWLHQPAIVEWACRRGRAAIFADTGLGKTLMQLEWANQVHKHTGKPVLLLAPLSVGKQTEREAEKFGVSDARYVAYPSEGGAIQITNYEKLDHFNPSDYAGIVLDESSILKGQTGAYRKMLTEFAANIEYRLSCTATPSPNDFMELGTQCEFLGIMSQVEMLSMFFTHDGSETQKWRLKGWGASKFWDWLATWAVVISSPADLGFDGSSYDLPPLSIDEVIIHKENKDGLFADVAMGLSAARLAKKSSVESRVKACADYVNSLNEPCVVWAETNEEADLLEKAIDGAVQVAGRSKDDHKINAALWFAGDDSIIAVNGKLQKVDKCLGSQNTQKTENQNTTLTQLTTSKRVLVSKSSIFGFGLNFQSSCKMAFVGATYSFEQFYQAVRREWRFGQTKPVTVKVFMTEEETGIHSAMLAKMENDKLMRREMIKVMSESMKKEITGASSEKAEYNPTESASMPCFL